MNTLYLIGNGFDISLGLKTRYSDFYKEYKQSAPVKEVEGMIIKDITDNEKTWSDMEKKLGEFTAKVDDPEAFIVAYESLYIKLCNYLKDQNNLFPDKLIGKYYQNLANPFVPLTPAEQVRFKSFINGLPSGNTIDLISFNYTNAFQKASGFGYNSDELKSESFRGSIKLNSLHQIHGSLGSTVLFGVNDVSQIKNTSFAGNPNITDFLVKPQLNANLGSLRDEVALNQIQNANLIVVFGMSIGVTDRTWWQTVANRLKGGSISLLIFYHTDNEIPVNLQWKIQRVKRVVKNRFLDIAGINGAERETLSQRITVSLSSPFNL